MREIEVPVLIVGGGGCGLSASAFLSNLGVEHLLVERHSETSHLPKAHYLNQRSMEVWRNHGMADRIYEVGTPIEHFGQVRWRTTLGGDGPLDGRTFFEMDAFGGGSLYETYERHSPCMTSNYPQIRLEPLLREMAEERAPGRVLFSHELESWEDGEGGVTATIRDRERDEALTVRARYVIAADGGKTVGAQLGVAMLGPTNMVDMVSVHFGADLSEWVDDRSLITWFLNPEGEGSWSSGAMVQMGPTWGRHSEEWVIHFGFRPDDPERFDEEKVIPRMRDLLKLPDLDLHVFKVSHWILDRIHAERFRVGNFFLAGDAVHRQPPTTGLGLNGAVQDVHNLCWKLAAVLRGDAGEALLDSYEAERLPVGAANADWALHTFMNHAFIDAGIGLTPGAPIELNQAALGLYFADSVLGEAVRERTAVAIGTQASEFQAHGIELGYRYEDGALVPDGSAAPADDPFGRTYTPTTRPGHRLPHAWLQRDGARLSTHDLVRPGAFALIAGPQGGDWVRAARELSAGLGIEIEAVSVGDGGTCADVDGQWAEVCEVGADGAVLVRPDQHVGWRSPGLDADPAATLRSVLGTILAQPVQAPASA